MPSRILQSLFRRIDKFLSIDVNPDPVAISCIRSVADVQKWRIFSDAAFGGASRGSLELCSSADQEEQVSRTASLSAAPTSQASPPSSSSASTSSQGPSQSSPPAPGQHTFMRFSGRYSTALSEDSTLLRAGFIGCNNVLPKSLDLSLHDFLEFRIRSGIDHTYVASVRTDNYTGGDEEVWQAPLRPARPGEWESVSLPFNELIYTVRGRVGSNQAGGRMPRHAVMAVGITLPVTKGMGEEGDFCLDIASVEAKAEHRQGGAAQQKAFQGYLSSHEDPKTVDGFASRQKALSSGSSRTGEEVIGGRKLRKHRSSGLGTGGS